MKDTPLLMAVGLVVQTLWRILGILELISQKILNPGPGPVSEAGAGIGRDWKGRDLAGTGIPVDLYIKLHSALCQKKLSGAKKPTALGVPRRSPIQVLAELNRA